MESIKEHVGAYLERTGTSKKRLAEDMSMPYTTLNSKLRGEAEFTLNEGKRLADILALTVGDLLISPYEYAWRGSACLRKTAPES